MKNFILSMVIVTCFIGASVSSGIAYIMDPKIIYVDDDNTYGPWDGSIEHPYQHIQDAIDNASSGDTIFVYNGSYGRYGRHYNSIVIDKPIKLIGEDKYNTIIEGTSKSRILIIDSNDVYISGFTIENGYIGILLNDVSHNNISGNIIQNCGLKSRCAEDDGGGIRIENSSYNTIYNNSFSRCGIVFNFSYTDDASSHNIIRDNTVNDKPLVYLEDQSNIKIQEDAGEIILVNCENINISYQNISYTNYGCILFYSNNCTIVNNLFTNNVFGLILYYSNGNLVSMNNFTKNNNGLLFAASNNNIFSKNDIIHSNYEGITQKISYTMPKSKNNIITSNSIVNSGVGLGIDLIDSEYTSITYNTIKNDDFGIALSGTKYTTIKYNNFYSNRRDAYFTICYRNKWDSNYWDRPRVLPKAIFGTKIYNGLPGPGFEFDWHPADKPWIT